MRRVDVAFLFGLDRGVDLKPAVLSPLFISSVSFFVSSIAFVARLRSAISA